MRKGKKSFNIMLTKYLSICPLRSGAKYDMKDSKRNFSKMYVCPDDSNKKINLGMACSSVHAPSRTKSRFIEQV